MFVQLGVVTRICHPGSATRFDPKTGRHRRLVCVRCQKIIDIDDQSVGPIELPNTRNHGFQVTGYQIHSLGTCAECHPAPYYTDNLMHNMRTERFFKPQMINGRMASADGPIKTFPPRGLKDSPPYLHDRRLLTIGDTVEFFNLVTGVRLSEQEKNDLAAFLRCL